MTDKLNRQQSASQAYALTHFERKKERACILFRSYLPIYHEVPALTHFERKKERKKERACVSFRSYLPIYHEVPTSRPARGPFPTEGHPEDEGVAEEDR